MSPLFVVSELVTAHLIFYVAFCPHKTVPTPFNQYYNIAVSDHIVFTNLNIAASNAVELPLVNVGFQKQRWLWSDANYSPC